VHQLKRDLNRNFPPPSLPLSLNDKDAINNPEREKLKVNILATEILLVVLSSRKNELGGENHDLHLACVSYTQ